jgi:hypothetical protein
MLQLPLQRSDPLRQALRLLVVIILGLVMLSVASLAIFMFAGGGPKTQR